MLLPPQLDQQRRQIPVQMLQAMLHGVTAGADRNQPSQIVATRLAVMNDVGPFPTRSAAAAIPLENRFLETTRVSLGMIGGVVAAPAQSRAAQLFAPTDQTMQKTLPGVSGPRDPFPPPFRNRDNGCHPSLARRAPQRSEGFEVIAEPEVLGIRVFLIQ